ncbi:MAG: Crp/Fnr family transcriptional regulator [Myxococcota bacterium]
MSALAPDEKRRLLTGISIFSGLTDRELDSLSAAARSVTFGARKELFHKGDSGTQLYVVVEGRLKALTTSAEGSDMVYNIMGPGDVIGEIAILGSIERTLTVRTLEPCEMLVLDRRDLLALLRSRPELALELLAMLAQRVRDMGEKFEEVKFLNLPYRLARRFEAAARSYGKTEGAEVRIDLKLSQEEWGELAGATREAVNKQLRVWADQGLVRRENGYVILCRPEEMARLAHCVPL